MTPPPAARNSGRAAAWARRAVKFPAAAADVVRSRPSGIVVLIYHRVGQRSTMSVDLPTARFDEQMAELAESGRVISLDRAVDLLVSGEPTPEDLPGMPVVVTFDDGTADLADLVTPILASHGLPASLYLVTDFIDRGSAFPYGGAPLSWGAIADLVSSGVWSIESHTHTHTLLDRVSGAVVVDELDRSIDLIGEHVGRAPRHFAYPKALAGTPEAESAVRARFRSAALAGTRVNPFGGTDPWRLARSPIQVNDGMMWFRRKADGGLRTEDDLRRLVNRVRYASARS
jgi:peptidoglycan/xylan/chitin deacetylase (PgdA/CDA1 family)